MRLDNRFAAVGRAAAASRRAARAALGTWVHLVFKVIDAQGEVERLEVRESRSDRRAAVRTAARVARRSRLVPGPSGWWSARTGGGHVFLLVQDCPTGPTCQGECCGTSR